MAGSPRQRFGSVHTQLKLNIVAKYMPAFTRALSKTGFVLHYIDAFAGTGLVVIKIGQRERTVPGSAFFALQCDPPFHKLLFVEKSKRKVQALTALASMSQKHGVEIRQDDANIAIPEYIDGLTARDRAIVFLDPFGMQVGWSTLQRIAASKVADVWYLFPLSGLYRQAARDSANIDAAKEAALTWVLGPNNWREALYEPPRQAGLFGNDTDVRTVDAEKIADWVKTCLAAAFPAVVGPKILYLTREDGSQGAPIFALFFLVSNPDPKAISLAKRIATDLLKR